MTFQPSFTKESRENNFGLFRLILATMVIFSHSPELIDGNRSREPLSLLFGTLSLGEISVDGFFLISGYLITQSFSINPNIWNFLRKRSVRILPAYLVAFGLCSFALAPLITPNFHLTLEYATKQMTAAIQLGTPVSPNNFPKIRYPFLNGSMWTISYEFRCYIMAAMFGLLCLYTKRYRYLVILITAVLFLLNSIDHSKIPNILPVAWFGASNANIHLFYIFSVGSIFYIFSDKIELSGRNAILALSVMFAMLSDPQLAEPAVVIFGGYALFYAALKTQRSLAPITNTFDVSYGIYLYAWPIQTIIILARPEIEPWKLSLTTFALSTGLGCLSWILIEKPALSMIRANRASYPITNVRNF